MQGQEQGSASQLSYAFSFRNKIRIAKIQDKFEVLKQINFRFTCATCRKKHSLWEADMIIKMNLRIYKNKMSILTGCVIKMMT